jgi:hypothetical protein
MLEMPGTWNIYQEKPAQERDHVNSKAMGWGFPSLLELKSG